MLAQVGTGLGEQPVGVFGLPSGFRCRVSMQLGRIRPHGPILIYCAALPPEPPIESALRSASVHAPRRWRPRPELRLKRGEDRRLSAGHLWVFSNEIDTDAHAARGVRARRRCAQITSRPRAVPGLRLRQSACADLRAHPEQGCRPSHRSRAASMRACEAALALRERLYREPYYRLVFGESDGLPGLVLDRYGDVIVGQIATAGMEALKATSRPQCASVLAPAGLFWKNDSAARELEHLPQLAEAAFGEVPRGDRRSSSGAALRGAAGAGAEDRLVLRSDRQPRSASCAICWPGARVLDVCSYVGAWAITALQAGARRRALRRFLAAGARFRRSATRRRTASRSRRCAPMPSRR